MTPNAQPAETIDQARRRLAQKARESGVTLRRDADGRWYASSVSQPGTWHYVTGFTCDCLGFGRVQRCMHHSALLAHLGWLPEDPRDPDPAAPGSAFIAYHAPEEATAHDDVWVTAIVVDGRETIRVTGDGDALRVQWVEQGRVIDDLTDCTPPGLDHRGAVACWVERIGAAILMQLLVPLGDARGPETFRDAA
jgi:hypothetical protein